VIQQYNRRLLADCHMGAFLLVLLVAILQLFLCVREAQEPARVQTFALKRALNERFARRRCAAAAGAFTYCCDVKVFSRREEQDAAHLPRVPGGICLMED
jgi:hypothetical protein